MIRVNLIILATLTAVTMGSCLTNAGTDMTTVVFKQVSKPPVIDGQSNDLAWQESQALQIGYGLGSSTPLEVSAGTIKGCLTKDALYILAVFPEPNPGLMVRSALKQDEPVWMDDSLEVFLAPDIYNPSRYYHIVINANGTVQDEALGVGMNGLKWNAKTQVKTFVGKDSWTIELRLPFFGNDSPGINY